MLLDAIRTQIDTLSRSEKKVALAVLDNPSLTLAENITALARSAQVSEPTVVRFCRALGYDGWQEFKLRLAQGLALAPPEDANPPLPDDLAADLVAKICTRSINALLDLRNNLDPEAIQRALDILAKARKIEFYGQGSSGIIAADAQHKFFRSGIPTVAYSDPHVHSIAAALLAKGDAVVAISQRGTSTSVIRSVQLARKAGADVIVLAPRGTPLADLANVLVPIDIGADNDPYTPISARLAHLAVIDMLAVGLALRAGPERRRKILAAQRSLQRIDMHLDAFTAAPQPGSRRR
ncbi:MurR/RpiR family transcriptional regulator [Lacisediminimonas sp.]|uniref:MurR/RpiR family transcriptional regulator n=1 Tax=Lacisediminimonas sp. TaxID=3060582 RepID=UPI002720319F|nr:SIS domain-containing protein [Lacisediminimonas sp.]MDO8299199.1 SIS domain-containing protein [Lacisediminimonas sp.]MDO9218820.1 SIS domain-containing protein [Lacisediminimonas sp.]